MLRTHLCVVLAGLLALPSSASAQTDKYDVTAEEHAACDADVYRLCSDSQNQDQVLACMRGQRQMLTSTCRVVFESGMKRRHLRL